MFVAGARLYLLATGCALVGLGVEHLTVRATGLPRLAVLAGVTLILFVAVRSSARARVIVVQVWRAAERPNIIARALLFAAVVLFSATLNLVFEHRVAWLEDLGVGGAIAAATFMFGGVAVLAEKRVTRRR